eukprot:CAMPEP_0117734116 /NCGR_PEP_ID=MMETSP0947-20121206/478_1 /TAXON_ID=44440 /ORGANISM="Chattonella subsalsa, Strain CCMP2191" /LENGTH=237 /DNA_ID=CAMNT_0005548825 /DNA_START=536 /DNA_END=1245 /DNA_ORIENTATION=-
MPEFLLEMVQASNLTKSQFQVKEIPLYNEEQDFGSDSVLLSLLCNTLGITVFLSSQYTKPVKSLSPRTKHILLIHDLMPERFGWNMQTGFWSTKQQAINEAHAIVTVSNSTTSRLKEYYPLLEAPISSSWNGVNVENFNPATITEIQNLTLHYDIPQPYVMLVGLRMGYKNGHALYRTFQQVDDPPAILLVGGDHVGGLEEQLLQGLEYRQVQLADSELAVAYSGASAFVQLSTEEG